MKHRLLPFPALLIALAALLLAGCDFSLAGDITPPPDYVSPTPMPTLGALYPASAPNLQDGAVIYAENCQPCHGDQGLGDGPQSQQLPVTVPGVGLPEVARPASPAQWFTVVSQGNLDRFMPPFIGTLNDQQRWDVIAYMMSLHTSADQLAQGKALFEANCADCAAKFSNLQKMAGLSEADLFAILKNGNSDFPAFGKDLSDDQAWAEAAYIRTLTYAVPAPSATPAATTAATQEIPAGTGTAPAVSGTPAATAATPAPGMGTVNGSIQIASGSLPAGLTVTLRGFDHGQDQSSGPQEVMNTTTTAAADGTFVFNNVSMAVNRIFTAEVEYKGIQYQSDFKVASAGTTQLTLPPIKVHEASDDYTLLKISQVHYYSDFATQGTAQFLVIYSFLNPGDKTVVLSSDGKTIPFIKIPAGAQDVGYQAAQNSATLASTQNGFAAPPSDQTYSIIAFFTLPYNNSLKIDQPFALDTPSVLVLIPDGMKVEGAQLTSQGIQAIQNVNYQELTASDLKAGDTLSFTVSGSPKTGPAAAAPDNLQGWLIGAGVFGLALIGAGVWMFMRDRRPRSGDEAEEEFETTEDIMDAILALDDLHRAGKINTEAYRSRRDELKEILKGRVQGRAHG